MPFNNAFAPGPKDFDFDINQVSITEERETAVDFSDGYYEANQALVGFADSDAAGATSVEDLRDLRLGAQVGTTSLDFIIDVIEPTSEPFVYNDNSAAKAALDAQQVDGIVLDLPTALYVSAVEIEGTEVIGQFPVAEGCVPVLLVLFLLGFGVPTLRLEGVPSDPIFWATVALVLSYSAYVSEVYRAGIDSVHESQRAAARSLGLSSGKARRYVVLPQAVRRVVPPLLNDFIALQKETALVGVFGPIEAARQAQIIASRSFNFTSYVAAALIFLALTVPLTRLTDHLLRRSRARTSGVPLA